MSGSIAVELSNSGRITTNRPVNSNSSNINRSVSTPFRFLILALVWSAGSGSGSAFASSLHARHSDAVTHLNNNSFSFSKSSVDSSRFSHLHCLPPGLDIDACIKQSLFTHHSHEFDGCGMREHSDGGIDRGIFNKGKLECGTRTLESKESRAIREGSFKKNKLHGDCFVQHVHYSDGSVYTREGTCNDGKLVNGTKILTKNHKYHTEWNGEFHQGRLIDGTKKYPNGAEAAGKFDPFEMLNEGKAELPNGDVGQGTFLRGQLHGVNCSLKYADGTTEVGTFEQGIFVQGERTNILGTVESGTFNDKKLHGVNCSREYADCAAEVGTFEHGIFVQGERTDTLGTVESGTFDPQTGKFLEGERIFVDGRVEKVVPFDWTFGLSALFG